MSDLVERLEAPLSMSQFQKQDHLFAELNRQRKEAAAELTRLQKELETARDALECMERDRDYWKVEAEGETAKVVYRDKLLKQARADALEEADRVMSMALSEGSKIPSGAVPYINGIRQAIRALKDKEVAG